MVGQSVAWGAVAEIGYAARAGADRRAQVSGSGAISRAVAVDALCCALAPLCRSFAVFPVEWSTLLASASEARGFLAPYFHLRRRPGTSVATTKARADVGMATKAARPNTSGSRGGVTVTLSSVLDMVGRTAGGFVDADAPLLDSGVDSLGAVELRNQLQATSEAVLPSTLVFDHPTARQLAAILQPAASDTVAPCEAFITLEAVVEIASRTAGGFVDADAPLLDSGVDSLGAVELRNQLQGAVGDSVALPSTLVFDHPTARQLMLYCADQHAPALSQQLCRTAPAFDAAQIDLAHAGATLPGGAKGAEHGWRFVSTGSDAFGSSPSCRWQPNSHAAATDQGAEGLHSPFVRYGAFLCGTALFDHAAFAVSTAEATTMDPQQRLLLELGYEVLHGAGARRTDLMESDTAVYAGVMSTEARDSDRTLPCCPVQ